MALDHAISEDRLSENVARKAKLPKTSEDNTKVANYFTTDEARPVHYPGQGLIVPPL